MSPAASLRRISAFSPEQTRVKASLATLKVEFNDRCWIWHEQPSFTACRKIDWESFLAPLSEYVNANQGLGETLRWLTACWLTGCGGEFVPVAASTVHNRIRMVRQLLRALLARHECLETVTPRQAQAIFRGLHFDAHGECIVKEQTLRLMLYATQDLYRLRAYLPIGFSVEPFPPGFVRDVLSRARRSEPWVAPPEPVCLELIRQAIRLLGPPADDVIRLRNKYILACESAKKRERRRQSVREIAARTLQDERFATLPGEDVPWTSVNAKHPQAIKRLVAALEGACATILLFLSGPRASELHLARPGCLRYLRHSNGIDYPYYFARRSKQKQARDAAGVPYRLDSKNRGWILGPAGVRALEVLERLSHQVRSISKVDSYWASVGCSGLWACTHRLSVTATSPSTLNIRLNVFASVIGLAERTGWRGRLHSHMGRKACARFIAKRDRTALADLALQFGHLSAYVTDASYARPDAEYRRLIDEDLAVEMHEAAVELAGLDVARTFSHMVDTQVTALRDRVARFVGELYTTADVRRLLGRGVRLVPCDWGMCVYREETSACGGNQFGPSSERRSPVVCRNCVNFLATEKHRPYWRRRIEDCERVLALRDIPEQVRRLVELRMREAKEVISSISGDVFR